MPNYELLSLRQQVQETAQTLIQRNAISPAHFANISARVPGEQAMLLTSAATLSQLKLDDIAVVGFDGRVRAGRLPGGTFEIVNMHAKVYERRRDVGGIIHTHSPYATAFAVANRPLPCIYEPLARYGLHDGIPVAAYAPRGSEEAVTNILAVIGARTRAVLLQNHGILAFGEDLQAATTIALILEEAAHLALLAETLGGATVIPRAQAAHALRRASEFTSLDALPAAERQAAVDWDWVVR